MKPTEFKVSVPFTMFPNSLVSDKEKNTQEYGLKIGTAITAEWFFRDGGIGRFYSRMNEFHRLRMYGRGEQSIQQYKDELAINGDLSHLNLSWEIVPVIPKFVDIVVNGMSERLFKVKAYAQDAMSQAKRSKFQDLIEGQMVAKDVLVSVKELTGVDPFVTSPDELPETDEELSLYMQLNYKPAIEIAEEEAINTVLEENHWPDIDKRVKRDIVDLGVGMAKHEFLPGAGVELCYVDPAYVIHSYTEDPHFRDVFYWGEIKTLPITEVYKIDPKISKEKLEEISQYSSSWYDYYNLGQFYNNSLFRRDTCTLLYFNYKTTKKVVLKKINLAGGGTRIVEKDESFNPFGEDVESGRVEKIEKTIDVWYNGIMVPGTNILLKWEMAENMVRPKSSAQHALPNYVACAPNMYKGTYDSLTRRMIPSANLIQITHLKLQQVVNKVVPDGVFIDADGINEVDLGTGAAYNPEDALRLYFQTGSVIGRSYTQDGEFNNGRVPIQELSKNSGASKVQMLLANYNHYLDQIRTVTGLNEARDGSTPDPKALVGVQKLAALNSNTATRHILDASLSIFQGMCEAISCRIADILEYSDFKEDFANKIGKYNTSILEEIKDLYVSDFGIFIEISPDEEEKAQLEANIQIALAQQTIDLSDVIDIREIKNLKLANQLLKLKQAKKEEREERMEMQKQAMIAQQNLKAQEMAAETTMQKVKFETESKIAVIAAQSEADKALLDKESEVKKGLMYEEFWYNMQLAGVEAEKIIQRDTMKEDRKDKRTDLQANQQSRILNQRQLNLPPQRFESTDSDVVNGEVSLKQFEPT